MIHIKNLHKKYGEQVIFQDFNYDFNIRERVCLISPSGCGKTTLFRLLLGLETPDKGEITGMEGLEKSVVFQEDRLCENLSALDNIVLPHLKKDTSFTLEQAKEGLSILGLKGSEYKPVYELSGGMRRRVSILRALFASYDILFLDEPFKGLDDKTKKLVMSYVKQKTEGKTVFWITHDKRELEFLDSQAVLTLEGISKNPGW